MNERIKQIGQAIAIGGLLLQTGCVNPERAAAVAPTPQATQTPDQLYGVERGPGRYKIFSLKGAASISIELVPGDSSRRFIRTYARTTPIEVGLILAENYCGGITDYTAVSIGSSYTSSFLARTRESNCPQLIPGPDRIDPQLLPR